jgi:hypothetical protein
MDVAANDAPSTKAEQMTAALRMSSPEIATSKRRRSKYVAKKSV